MPGLVEIPVLAVAYLLVPFETSLSCRALAEAMAFASLVLGALTLIVGTRIPLAQRSSVLMQGRRGDVIIGTTYLLLGALMTQLC